MNFTSRSRYALKIMLDLAHHVHEPLVRRQDIVRRQGVPSKYLDQILVKLRRESLVVSVRGRTGGYRLQKLPQDVTIWDIFHAVEDGIYPVACVDEHHICEFKQACISSGPWEFIFETLRAKLSEISLAAVAGEYPKQEHMCPMGGVRECRPGREPTRQIWDPELNIL